MRMEGVGKLSKYCMQMTVLVVETREHLQHIVSEFERLKIKVWKSKVLTARKDQMGSCEKVRVNWEEMQVVNKFNYFEVMISMDVGMGEEVGHRVLEEKSLGDDSKVVEVEHDIQRSKTGVI